MRLTNKIGIITGGSLGIGRAGALRFAKEGAAVNVVARNEKQVEEAVTAIQNAGGNALGLSGDLSNEAFARSVVHETHKHFGGLDFLWNNVGHPAPAEFEELDLTHFDQAININLRSAIASTSAAIPYMRQRGAGSVLFTASTSGLTGSPFSPTYSAAKFGLVGLARSLAKRYGKEQIRFNVICPGMTDTPMLRVFVARPDQMSTQGVDPEQIIKSSNGNNAIGRIIQPEGVANAALFLISDEAEFITGIALPVDGGAVA